MGRMRKKNYEDICLTAKDIKLLKSGRRIFKKSKYCIYIGAERKIDKLTNKIRELRKQLRILQKNDSVNKK